MADKELVNLVLRFSVDIGDIGKKFKGMTSELKKISEVSKSTSFGDVNKVIAGLTKDLSGVERAGEQWKNWYTSLSGVSKEVVAVNEGLKEQGKWATTVTAGIEGISLGWAKVTAGVYLFQQAWALVKEVVGFMDSFVREAAEAERAEKRLQWALEGAGYQWGELKQKVDEYAESIYKTTKYDDEDARRSMAQMMIYTQDYKKAIEGTTLAMNMSARSGVELSTAIRLIGMSVGGDAGRLTRYVRELKKMDETLGSGASKTERAAYIWGKLQEKFSGYAAKELETYDGQMAQFNKALKELKETLGMWVLPYVTDFVKGLGKAVEELRGFVNQVDRLFGITGKKLTPGEEIGKEIGAAEKRLKFLEDVKKKAATVPFYKAQAGDIDDEIKKQLAGIALLKGKLATIKTEEPKTKEDDLKTQFEKDRGMTYKRWSFLNEIEKAGVTARAEIRKGGIEEQRDWEIAVAKALSEDTYTVEIEFQKKLAKEEYNIAVERLKGEEDAAIASAQNESRTSEEIGKIRGKFRGEQFKEEELFRIKLSKIDAAALAKRNEAERKARELQFAIPESEWNAPDIVKLEEQSKKTREERAKNTADWNLQLAEITGSYEDITNAQIKVLEVERGIKAAAAGVEADAIIETYNARIKKAKELRDEEREAEKASQARAMAEPGVKLALKELDIAYEKGLLTIKEYYETKLKLQEKSIDMEINDLQIQKAVVEARGYSYAREKKLADINIRLVELQHEKSEIRVQDARDEILARRDESRAIADWATKLSEVEGSWTGVRDGQIGALKVQKEIDLELALGNEQLTKMIENYYKLRIEEEEAYRNLNFLKLAEKGIKEFSMDANQALADTFKTAFPDTMRSASDAVRTFFTDVAKKELKSFKDYFKDIVWSVYDIWMNVTQKFGEQQLATLLMGSGKEGAGGGVLGMLGITKPAVATTKGAVSIGGTAPWSQVGIDEFSGGLANLDAELVKKPKDIGKVVDAFGGLDIKSSDVSDAIKETDLPLSDLTDGLGMVKSGAEDTAGGLGLLADALGDFLSSMGNQGSGGGGLGGAIVGAFSGGGGGAGGYAGMDWAGAADYSAFGFQKGGTFIAKKPTSIVVGEGGEAEIVSVTPISKMISGNALMPRGLRAFQAFAEGGTVIALGGKEGTEKGKQKIELDISLDPGLTAKLRHTPDEIDMIVATKYRTGGLVKGAISGR